MSQRSAKNPPGGGKGAAKGKKGPAAGKKAEDEREETLQAVASIISLIRSVIVEMLTFFRCSQIHSRQDSVPSH